jgi:anti-sigma factor RsiW
MTTARPQPPEPHEPALLLPWYVAGTLAENERLMVEAHLRECPECRHELESVVSVRQSTRAMFEKAAAPSERLHAEVMARVRESRRAATESGAASPQRSRATPRPLLQSIAEGLQLLMRPKWAPALAVLLIVVQAGVLTRIALQGSPEPQVQPRGIEVAAARIRIVFDPQATARDIRAALTALGGRIVDGPSPEGAYVIELPEVEPTVLGQRLRELRARPALVERIENVVP